MCPCQHSEEHPLLGLSSDRSAGAQHIPLLSHRQSSPISKALVPDFWRSLALNQQGECQISAKKALFPHTEQECFSKACLWGTDFLPRLWWVSKENLLKGYSSFVLTYCTWTVFSQWKWKVSLGFKIRMQKYTQNIMLYLFFSQFLSWDSFVYGIHFALASLKICMANLHKTDWVHRIVFGCNMPKSRIPRLGCQ